MTKAEKKVADYILENAQEVLFMSITDLAAACKVGETTVFRFCKSMKLQGYQIQNPVIFKYAERRRKK